MAKAKKVSAKKNTGESSHVLLKIASVAALVGAYYLYGTDEGKGKRQKIKGWMIKAKGEVVERLENLKEIDKDVYTKIVDDVSKHFGKMKNVSKKEIDGFKNDLKKDWSSISKKIKSAVIPENK